MRHRSSPSARNGKSAGEAEVVPEGVRHRLSIIIANYNYEVFVASAIESALALEWSDVEVIVVDDGSSDGSRDVISAFSDRVQIIHQSNAGQRAAANRGFEATTGDVIIFLDSDDVLPPELPKHLFAHMGPGVSKVQFQMKRMDAKGVVRGGAFPRYSPVPTAKQIRAWMSTTSAYPTPPGSGNAYARWFLQRILPVGPEIGDFIDSACLAAAPFLGDVVAVAGVSIGYRQHADNDSFLLKDSNRFRREIERARLRWRYAQAAGGLPEPFDMRPLRRSRELLQLRVAARRMTGQSDALPGDGLLCMLSDALTALFQPGPEALVKRVFISAWTLITLVAPSPVARVLISKRYRSR